MYDLFQEDDAEDEDDHTEKGLDKDEFIKFLKRTSCL